MKTITILGLDPSIVFLGSLIILAIGFYISYLIIKAGVRDGVIAANNIQALPPKNEPVKQNITTMTPAQRGIYSKYERGEITIEEYKKLWDEIK